MVSSAKNEPVKEHQEAFWRLSHSICEGLTSKIQFNQPTEYPGLLNVSPEEWANVNSRSIADTYLRYALRTIAYIAVGDKDVARIPVESLESLLRSRSEELDERIPLPEDVRDAALEITIKSLLGYATLDYFPIRIRGMQYRLRNLGETLEVERITSLV